MSESEIADLRAALEAAQKERDALSPGRWYLLQRAETAEAKLETAEQRVAELKAVLREIARKQPQGVRDVTHLAYVQGLAEDALREGDEK